MRNTANRWCDAEHVGIAIERHMNRELWYFFHNRAITEAGGKMNFIGPGSLFCVTMQPKESRRAATYPHENGCTFLT